MIQTALGLPELQYLADPIIKRSIAGNVTILHIFATGIRLRHFLEFAWIH